MASDERIARLVLCCPKPMNAETDQPLLPPPGANLEHLWTPWRAAYVGGLPASGCFLCDLQAADPANDRVNLVLFRSPSVFALLNRFPYNPGHVLIAPRAHLGDFTLLDAAIRDDLFAQTQRVTTAVLREYNAGGFNVGLNLGHVAGAGVPDHLHVHVVPRWGGDTNFMTVIGEARVLPELLDQSFQRLRPYFAMDDH